MGTPAVGSVVTVSFPFSDLSKSKVRPAVVLASAERDDWILCQVTSKSYSDQLAVQISDSDFSSGALQVVSYVRPGKLFTANSSLFKAEIGILNEGSLKEVISAIVALLNPETEQGAAANP